MTMMLDLHLRSTAQFSADRRYRYRLGRRWGPGPALMFVSLNPSTAGEHINDATIRRDIRFARGFGYDALSALNLYAVRSTDPKAIACVDDPVGPDNDAYLDAAAPEHELIVFAWGFGAQAQRARAVATRIWRICRATGGTVAVLGWTQGGQPRHPLYMRADTQLECLSAGAHLSFLDVDARWSELLSDSAVLEGPGSVGAGVR
ncbi:MAG: hypothetical protein CK429_35680 [Mycobacterium sp.]|uniref:DUF1643 domain-containing protein n=1 Tax=Mycobacterium sp. TaxID=1785 RepID=UPI000CC4B6F5|nr:DUF1643 domain-containing protein [Mycobacterium sp.]PJE01153.1 MAG: hypothetical protein CK429_35680 [Mycobacterium sp.]PJE02469.1 MAG: hypothetical protein CK428_29845 [Mycobacterium sp.]PJE23045.1 MAG: hypothetical protein CK431_13310 [Mycobacterium sp.]